MFLFRLLLRFPLLTCQKLNISRPSLVAWHMLWKTNRVWSALSAWRSKERRCTCDLLVSGPALAIATMPLLLNCIHMALAYPILIPSSRLTRSVCLISSENGLPQILCPPFPVPVGSPPWIINPRIFLWNRVPLYCPEAQRAKKFYGKMLACVYGWMTE